MTQEPTPQRDFRKEVTEHLIQLLEQGVAPWQKPWNSVGSQCMPFNPTTGKGYRGGNALYLLIVAIDAKLSDPRWMTYKQAEENGWQVRRKERGTKIEFWDYKLVSEDAQDESADNSDGDPDQPRMKLIHRIYTVFNASQIDGIPPFAPKAFSAFEVVEAGESILAHSGATIAHDQIDQAFYEREEDAIHLPRREYFVDAPGYYGTALHELAHWTGHPSRLNRPTLTESYQFGNTNYAKEELRAEIASVFLAAERGIPHDTERHAAYVGSWIKSLKNDKNEIFRAASDAAKATDYLLALERGEDVTQAHSEEQSQQAEPQPSPAVRRYASGRRSGFSRS